MPNQTILSKQEEQWISERRVTRLSDQKEVQIYPMGAERYLASVLSRKKKGGYPIKEDILDKDVLVIPGYGNSSFLFALTGAKTVTVYDKDPVTIAWMKAFKKFYHYREFIDSKSYPSIGELLSLLTYWYPPLVALPTGKYTNMLFWAISPNALRRRYIHYMVFLARQAIQSKTKGNFELDKKIKFHAGTLDEIKQEQQIFDTAFVPYLLGVRNGIEKEKEIIKFIQQLIKIIPKGHILVNPSRNTKEFYITGKRYFVTVEYPTIQAIPALRSYVIAEDRNWFGTQGLTIFGSLNNSNS